MAVKFRSVAKLATTGFALWVALAQPLHAQDAGSEAAAEAAAKLKESGDRHTGILQINQSAADGAQQANILTVASVTGDGAALADSGATQQSINNVIDGAGDIRGIAIAGTGNTATGLVAINQSAARGISQVNNTAIAKADSINSLALAATHSESTTLGSVYSNATNSFATGPASITGTGNGLTGVFNINQAASVGGVQGNSLAVAVSNNGVASALGTASVKRAGSPASYVGSQAGAVSIAGSFNAASGIVQINQASGGFNSQSNILALAIGQMADATALSDSGLGEIGPQSEAEALAPPRQAVDAGLAGSFDGFSGIAQVSQVSGFGNVVNNNMTISLTHVAVPGI